ncbi:MAG: hypothetical protein OHK0029_17140 [Armatimonadaceae bacterium]
MRTVFRFAVGALLNVVVLVAHKPVQAQTFFNNLTDFSVAAPTTVLYEFEGIAPANSTASNLIAAVIHAYVTKLRHKIFASLDCCTLPFTDKERQGTLFRKGFASPVLNYELVSEETVFAVRR